jgi:hypothetical protein
VEGSRTNPCKALSLRASLLRVPRRARVTESFVVKEKNERKKRYRERERKTCAQGPGRRVDEDDFFVVEGLKGKKEKKRYRERERETCTQPQKHER